MRKLFLFIGILFISHSTFSQETYTINNEILELKTEVEGKLDLLWNVIDGKYRYFIRTEDNNIQELLNPKDDNNKFTNQYQKVLQDLTGNDAEDVDLTLYSLKEYIKSYNQSADSTVQYADDKAKLAGRIGGFFGLTNSPFVENPENATVPFFGVELEFFGKTEMPIHAGFFDIRHALDNDDLQYQETQLALGYRYRFINKPKFNLYANVKLVTYSISKATFTFEDEDNPGTIITEEEKGSTFEAPLIFGLGADIKVGENGYITLTYAEIFAAFLDLQGNFPLDFAVGYKFNL